MLSLSTVCPPWAKAIPVYCSWLGRHILCWGPLSYTKLLWCWCCKDDEIFNWQYLCGVWWTGISTSNRHSCWKLTVSHSLSTSFYTRTRQTLYRFSWKQTKSRLAQQFNFTYRYIDDVLSLNISKFSEYLKFIYPRELDIKETSEMRTPSSYLEFIPLYRQWKSHC